MPATAAEITERARRTTTSQTPIADRLRPADNAAMMIDPSLVNAARHGDRAAFAHLHAVFAPMVHGILLTRVPRPDADDLTQEVFLHAMKKLPSIKNDSAVGPWLAAMARNMAATLHRSRRPNQPLDSAVDRTTRTPHDGSTAEACSVLQAIQNLPDAYAETLVLRLVEGLTGPQIAACTGLTHGSVRVNLHRGMQMLRARLDQLNPGGNEP